MIIVIYRLKITQTKCVLCRLQWKKLKKSILKKRHWTFDCILNGASSWNADLGTTINIHVDYNGENVKNGLNPCLL
jgi:hypothetical protein